MQNGKNKQTKQEMDSWQKSDYIYINIYDNANKLPNFLYRPLMSRIHLTTLSGSSDSIQSTRFKNNLIHTKQTIKNQKQYYYELYDSGVWRDDE